MPEIGRIQSTNFQALLTELGITRNNVPFALRSEVTPVVLVGGTVSFVAAPTPAYRVPDLFTIGLQVAPPVNTVLADTGPLPVGPYSCQFIFTAAEAGTFDLQWRDAANASNLFTMVVLVGTGFPSLVFSTRFNVENANERFRIRNTVVGGVGIGYQATILARV